MMTQMTDAHIHILQTFFHHPDSLDLMQGIVSDWSSYSALENISKRLLSQDILSFVYDGASARIVDCH